MNKVYICYRSIAYEGSDTLEVFSSEDKAKEFCKTMNDKHGDWDESYNYEVFTLKD